jgi:hypothetical protein
LCQRDIGRCSAASNKHTRHAIGGDLMRDMSRAQSTLPATMRERQLRPRPKQDSIADAALLALLQQTIRQPQATWPRVSPPAGGKPACDRSPYGSGDHRAAPTSSDPGAHCAKRRRIGGHGESRARPRWVVALGRPRAWRAGGSLEHAHPGDLLHIDTKDLGRIERMGHRVTGDRAIALTAPAGSTFSSRSMIMPVSASPR